MKVELPDFDRALWLQFLDKSHQEGRTPTEVAMAWFRRALRQERSIMPLAQLENGKILPMRRR